MSEFKRIGECANVRRGASPRPINDPKWFGGNVGWVRIADVTRSKRFLRSTQQFLSPLGESKSVRLNEGDLIMSICATIGRPVIVAMPACIHDGFVQFYDINGLETNYFYYILQFAENQFVSMGQIGTQANLNTDLVRSHRIFCPPLSQQKKIARILTTIDNLIEKTEALIAKYKSIKQGMMNDLFTRGVDQNGRLRPPYEQAPQLYKDSELGKIPKDWEVSPIKDIADKIQDGTHFSPQSEEGPFRYITSKNIRFGYMDLSNCEWISEEDHLAIYKRCNVRFGDILLTKDGANTGNLCQNELHEPFSMLSSVALIRIENQTDSSVFFFHFMLSPQCQLRLKDLMAGNAITRLTLEKINAFKVVRPPKDEQLKISKSMASIHKTEIRRKSELKVYTQLKTGLMQDLLTGKVRVNVDELEEEFTSV